MMKTNKIINSQSGSGHILLFGIIFIAILGALSYVGYNAWQKQITQAGSTSTVGSGKESTTSTDRKGDTTVWLTPSNGKINSASRQKADILSYSISQSSAAVTASVTVNDLPEKSGQVQIYSSFLLKIGENQVGAVVETSGGQSTQGLRPKLTDDSGLTRDQQKACQAALSAKYDSKANRISVTFPRSSCILPFTQDNRVQLYKAEHSQKWLQGANRNLGAQDEIDKPTKWIGKSNYSTDEVTVTDAQDNKSIVGKDANVSKVVMGHDSANVHVTWYFKKLHTSVYSDQGTSKYYYVSTQVYQDPVGRTKGQKEIINLAGSTDPRYIHEASARWSDVYSGNIECAKALLKQDTFANTIQLSFPKSCLPNAKLIRIKTSDSRYVMQEGSTKQQEIDSVTQGNSRLLKIR